MRRGTGWESEHSRRLQPLFLRLDAAQLPHAPKLLGVDLRKRSRPEHHAIVTGRTLDVRILAELVDHGVDELVDKDGNITFKYDIEKNSEVAGNLKGRLLITTGDIDNNVHPGGTIRLANALIKANKRFDFFLFPGQRHGYGPMSEYFFWIRADYFCKHLIGDYSQSVDIDAINRDIEKKR